MSDIFNNFLIHIFSQNEFKRQAAISVLYFVKWKKTKQSDTFLTCSEMTKRHRDVAVSVGCSIL